MPASYREIDYRVRPAKHAERLMMIDTFRHLRFSTVESYQYIGLGSVYFSDFALVHRALGIRKLVSIERATNDRMRFEANIPYSCIDMLWGETSAQLPNIDFTMRSIVWLDYDGRLSRPILGDIREVAGRAVGGTVLALTVQCKFDPVQEADGSDGSVRSLEEAVGPERVPLGTTVADLRGKKTGDMFRNIILLEIDKTLADRNIDRHVGQHIKYKQILYFRYEDGVKMMTVVLVFYDAGQSHLLDLCGFTDLEFYRDGVESFDINIPKLTPREIKRLEAIMPGNIADLVPNEIPMRDAKQYASIYRYFPNITFVEG